MRGCARVAFVPVLSMLPLSFDADARRANRIMVQSRRISKRFARWPETRIPPVRERVARSTSDLRGVLETARAQDPLHSALACEDAAGNARDTRDSRLAASRGAENGDLRHPLVSLYQVWATLNTHTGRTAHTSQVRGRVWAVC